jgi:hypothetical protein
MPDHDGIELDPVCVDTATLAEEKNSKYAVGYGKPPRSTRFKPGQSGNPNGRARKSTTFDDDIEKELRTFIVIRENGKQKRITKRQAIAKQHVNRALQGDIKSTALLFQKRQQNRSDQQDTLDALLEEFRERNRRISGKDEE